MTPVAVFVSFIGAVIWAAIGAMLWSHEDWEAEEAMWWPIYALKALVRGFFRAIRTGWLS